ncbi:unnamed protein product [Ranitomeya imitator]|uniref:Integral membrane protein 2 n=1 Tax=Ranitomeya imitator TaxID=111125 RepID=A0ABN9MFH1_9NEOB|nr:unnamed protein product [Ranitomeya imitator]
MLMLSLMNTFSSYASAPKNFLELLINIKAWIHFLSFFHGNVTTFIRRTMPPLSKAAHLLIVLKMWTKLGVFIRRLCQDKETYKLQRRNVIRGKQKRETENCFNIYHFENTFAMETTICNL